MASTLQKYLLRGEVGDGPLIHPAEAKWPLLGSLWRAALLCVGGGPTSISEILRFLVGGDLWKLFTNRWYHPWTCPSHTVMCVGATSLRLQWRGEVGRELCSTQNRQSEASRKAGGDPHTGSWCLSFGEERQWLIERHVNPNGSTHLCMWGIFVSNAWLWMAVPPSSCIPDPSRGGLMTGIWAFKE